MPIKLRIAQDVEVIPNASGVTLDGPLHRLDVPRAPTDWTPLEALVRSAEEFGLFAQAAALGLLEEGCFTEGRLCLSIRVHQGSGLGDPVAGSPPFRPVAHLSAELSGEGSWELSSPLAHGRAIVRDPALLGQLHHPDPTQETTGLLRKAGLLVPQSAAMREPALGGAGLRLHGLSRRGSAPGPVGAQANPPPRARKVGSNAIALPDPGPMPETSLAKVFETRKSQRIVAPPATDETISRLLALAARLRADGHYPVPSPGRLNDFDIYVARPKTLQRYVPDSHALNAPEADPRELLEDAGLSMNCPCTTLLVLAAPFERMTLRYADAAYPLLLKTAGCLMQSLHLAATALGEGSCFIGGGNTRHFARLTGRDPLTYGPLGEIALTGSLQTSKDG